MVDYDFTKEDIELVLKDKNIREAIFKESEKDNTGKNSELIDNMYKLKQLVISLEHETNGVMSRDILMANLDKEDKKQINSFLNLASKFKELKLNKPARFFTIKAHILAGVSRGVNGFQQDKLNETRETRIAELNGLKSSGFFKRN